MKSFRKLWRKALFHLSVSGFGIVFIGWAVTASGALPDWIRNTEARTEIEAAFFRLMSLPGGDVLFRRPPRETRPALAELIKKQPESAKLYSLRALEDEQQLDFRAAEADWKLYADHLSNESAAQLALADFYHRRLRAEDEIKALSGVASASAQPGENFTPTHLRRRRHRNPPVREGLAYPDAGLVQGQREHSNNPPGDYCSEKDSSRESR